jgi:hypothetical protein
MIIVQSTENEFYIAGTGLTVSLFRNPDVDSPVAESKASKRSAARTATAARSGGPTATRRIKGGSY